VEWPSASEIRAGVEPSPRMARLQALAPVTQNLWCRLGYPERPEPNAPSLLLSERSASLSSLVFSSLP
jgi:hypothetical protein